MLKKLSSLFLGLSAILSIAVLPKSADALPLDANCLGTSINHYSPTDFYNFKAGNFIDGSTSNSEFVQYCSPNLVITKVNNSGQLESRQTVDISTPLTLSSLNVMRAVGDLNNDGNTDVLIGSTTPNGINWDPNLKVALMNGTSVSSAATISQSYDATQWRPFGICDVTGDGKNDILWQGQVGTSNAGKLAYWEMNGTSFVSAGLLSQTAASGWYAADCKDYDNDGKPDFFFATAWDSSTGNKSLGYWKMNGTTFVSSGVIATINFSRSPNFVDYPFAGFAKYNGSSSFSSVFLGFYDTNPFNIQTKLGYWQTNGAGTITSSAWFTNPNNL